MVTFNKLYIILAQFIASVLYIGSILIAYGIIPSISDSFLELRKTFGRGSLTPYIFWLYLIFMGASIFTFLDFSGAGFLSLAGLCLVGAASDISKKSVQLPHGIGAVTGIVVAFIGIAVYGFQHDQWWAAIAIAPQLILMWILAKSRTIEHEGTETGEFFSTYVWTERVPVLNYILWIELAAIFFIMCTELLLELIK